jgi:hypothetical protein
MEAKTLHFHKPRNKDFQQPSESKRRGMDSFSLKTYQEKVNLTGFLI